MSNPEKTKRSWKDRFFREMVDFWFTFVYLALVFAAFTQYRRFVLAAHDIEYTNYWVAVIKALVLAKVILIGEAVRLGRGLEEKPLIYPTVYKTVVFGVFVFVFTVIEHAIKGLWHGDGLMGGVAEYFGRGIHELLAGFLIMFVALLPYFAIRELGRVYGAEKIRALFFSRRDGP